MARWEFQKWQDGDVNVIKTIAVSADITLTASYVQGFTLSISSTPTGVAFTVNGQSLTTPFVQTLQTGTYTVVMPQTIASYTFRQWSDGDTNLTKTVNLTADTTLSAVYQAAPTTITLNVTTGGNGSVSPSGSQILTIGQSYSFTATPNTNYKLDHWELAGLNVGAANPYTLTATSTMNGQTLLAIFALQTITLNVVAGTNGQVSPSGSQILTLGQAYSFGAYANAGYQLDHWDLSGANQGSSNPLSITTTSAMDGKTLTALFTSIPPQQITLNVATSGSGSVNLVNGPHTFNVGNTVTFTATPGTNNAFSKWTLNGASYSANPLSLPITLNMNGQTLTAVFAPTAITLTVASMANGTVTPSGTFTLVIGQPYLFIATPDSGYTLDHWDLNGTSLGSSNPITITVTADMNGKTLTALFTLAPKPTITLNIATTGKGITNPASGPQTLNVGDTVQFTAIASSGSSFTDWKFNGTKYTDNPLKLTITQDMNGKTLIAEFTGATVISGLTIAGIIAVIGVGSVLYLATRNKK